jgi:hypothetical protein
MPNDKQQWLEEALSLVPEMYGRKELGEVLTLELKRCHSSSRHTFWQWLRLTLAKNPNITWFVEYLRESRLPEEVVPPTVDDFPYEVSADGTTALIPVGNDDAHGIWKLPVVQLGWARSIMPVFLKRLPDLEPVEAARQRQIKHQSHYMKAKLSSEQMKNFEKELKDLDEQVSRLYKPVPRYCLMKWTSRRDIPVHRMYVGVLDEGAEVTAIDGDFLNFCPVKVRIILEPVPDKDGIAGGRGKSSESVVMRNNLQIVPPSSELQINFERSMLQFKWTDKHDDVVASNAVDAWGNVVWAGKPQSGKTGGLTIQPNWDLGKRTGVYGRIEDCGKSAPATEHERRDLGMVDSAKCGRTGRRRDKEADAIRRKWRGF